MSEHALNSDQGRPLLNAQVLRYKIMFFFDKGFGGNRNKLKTWLIHCLTVHSFSCVTSRVLFYCRRRNSTFCLPSAL